MGRQKIKKPARFNFTISFVTICLKIKKNIKEIHMKKHTGCSMQYEIKFPGLCQNFLKSEVNLSKKAEFRLKVIDWYRLKSKDYSTNSKPNAELTCRHFGLSRSTFYFWLSKFNNDFFGG